MAKGDKKKVESRVGQAVDTSRAANEAVTNQMIVPTTQSMFNNYQNAANQQMGDYNDIMNRYRSFQADPANKMMTPQQLAYSRSPELAHALAGYGIFADTGGFSADDLTNMRARGISPVRAVYANAMNEMARQKNLAGGYSPNFNAATSKMTGSLSQQIADRVQDVNAQLAQMVQQGKLAGLQGLSGASIADAQMANQMAMANAENQLRAGQFNYQQGPGAQNLAALGGMANLYGTSPGLASTFGNQVLNSTRNWLDANQQGQGVGQMGIQGQLNAAQVPSNFETGLGRVGSLANIGGAILNPFLGGGGSSLLSPTRFGQQGGNPFGTTPFNW